MAWKPMTRAERLMFRALSDAEEDEFLQYACEHDPPERVELTHPVCRVEWERLGKLAPSNME